jgi:hypothetical protein
MSYKIEQEIKELRIPMLEAYDSGNESLGDDFADLISELAVIFNSGLSKEEYYEMQEYERERNIISSN